MLSSQNDIDLRIQKALETFATGLRILEPSEMFVTHVSCLEAIVVLPNEPAIKAKLAERISYIIASRPQDRQILAKRVEELYNVRSSIVHRGEVIENISEYHSNLLRVLYNLIVELSKGKFASLSEIIEYTNGERHRKSEGLKAWIARRTLWFKLIFSGLSLNYRVASEWKRPSQSAKDIQQLTSLTIVEWVRKILHRLRERSGLSRTYAQ
jgi:hypothetical protein